MLLIFIAFIWGSTFVLVKEALKDASPLALNSARMIVAAVLLAVFYRKKIAVLTKACADGRRCWQASFFMPDMHFRPADSS